MVRIVHRPKQGKALSLTTARKDSVAARKWRYNTGDPHEEFSSAKSRIAKKPSSTVILDAVASKQNDLARTNQRPPMKKLFRLCLLQRP